MNNIWKITIKQIKGKILLWHEWIIQNEVNCAASLNYKKKCFKSKQLPLLFQKGNVGDLIYVMQHGKDVQYLNVTVCKYLSKLCLKMSFIEQHVLHKLAPATKISSLSDAGDFSIFSLWQWPVDCGWSTSSCKSSAVLINVLQVLFSCIVAKSQEVKELRVWQVKNTVNKQIN